jgi:phosphohistidine phosphatase
MIALYLIRHAVAENRSPTRWPDDSKRPLTPEGTARFRRAAHGLRRIVPSVDRLVSSPHVRAWQTAEVLRDEAGWPEPERSELLTPMSEPKDSLVLLEGSGTHTSIALVGHEPHLSMLASLLVSGDDEAVHSDLKKGGVIALEFESNAAPGAATLRWVVTPKILRRLAPARVDAH